MSLPPAAHFLQRPVLFIVSEPFYSSDSSFGLQLVFLLSFLIHQGYSDGSLWETRTAARTQACECCAGIRVNHVVTRKALNVSEDRRYRFAPVYGSLAHRAGSMQCRRVANVTCHPEISAVELGCPHLFNRGRQSTAIVIHPSSEVGIHTSEPISVTKFLWWKVDSAYAIPDHPSSKARYKAAGFVLQSLRVAVMCKLLKREIRTPL